MLRKMVLLPVVLQFLLFGVILQVRDTVAYGQAPEETRKLVRNLAGKWCEEVTSGLMNYYDLIVTGDNTFILEYKFTKSTGSARMGSMKNVFNMTVAGDSLEGTHTHWVDMSQMGCSVEEKTFPASGIISNNGNTLNITWDHPMPNMQDGGRWTSSAGRRNQIFSRAR